ncbi:MAG: universal stress protein [Actinobacteria bacterium]|nr:universal stress protein [Actinomycetota bacterium]
MARPIPGLSRALDTSSIASVAYGEIGSSIYFALGIVAVYALGFTPWVLLLVGGLFLLVALSYAEGTAAIPEVGGAAMFVRRAFNDPAGFLTGWVLLLDYLIVIALAALFVPHYLGHAVGVEGLRDRPWDVVAGIGVIAFVSAVRLFRRPGLYRLAVLIAAVSLAVHLLIIVAGFVVLLSTGALGKGVDLGTAPTWSSIAFALPLAMLAYTGLETVANLASETREPGRTLPRSLFAGIGAAVGASVAIGLVGISAYPAHVDPAGAGQTSDLGTTWLRAPLVGIASAFDGHLPGSVVDVFRVFVGVTGVLILLGAVSTSISGAGRLAYSLGRHDMLPHAFGVLNRRTLIAPISIVSTVVMSSGLLLVAYAVGGEVRFLASLYSFGVLLAFVAAQVAVIRLRVTQPDLPRPFRVPFNVRVRGAAIPVAALIGIPLTAAVWLAGLVTHEATRIAGPIWVVAGALVFVAVRRTAGEPVLGRVQAAVPDLVPEVEGVYGRILVPVKLGQIGDEVLATAIRFAEEHRGSLRAVHVISVPLSLRLDAELLAEEERAGASLVDAGLLATEHGIELEQRTIRARSIGHAIVGEASEWGADLIVLGSAPRWRRQSRFFSPTVDYVLRHAPCEVMVIAYPQGILDEPDAARGTPGALS